MDKWLALFLSLLLVSVLLFLLGYFPYPFGLFILLIAIFARLSALHASK